MTPTPDGRFFCESCLGRYAGRGDCLKCPGEPLLDLCDDETRLMLEEFDSKAKMRRYTIILMVVIVLTMPISLGLIFFWLGALIGTPAAAGLVAAITAGLAALLPPKVKMPQLKSGEIEQMQQKYP